MSDDFETVDAHSPACHGPVQTPSPTSLPTSNSSRPGSSSRAIVPTPSFAAAFSSKVALASASSPPCDYGQPSPVGGGPTSASYVVPPRPKPGRKPATDEPASKRKAQNRESQRAFRARKAAKLNEMQAQVETAEQRHQQQMNDKLTELNDVLQQNQRLQTLVAQKVEEAKRLASERDFWKEKHRSLDVRNQQLEQLARQAVVERPMSGWEDKSAAFFQGVMPGSRHDSPTRQSITTFTSAIGTPQAYSPTKENFGCGNCKANGECACVEEMANLQPDLAAAAQPPRDAPSPMKDIQQTAPPPVDLFAEREIDFTKQFASKQSRLDNRPSIPFLTSDMNCGFCTDPKNCICREELRLQQENAKNEEMPPPIKDSANDSATAGPGTCADCMSNPRQKAWCQRVAQLRSSSGADYLSSRSSRNSSISSSIDPIDTRNDSVSAPDLSLAKYSIGCSDAYKLFEGRVPTDPDSADWSQLRPIEPPVRNDGIPQRKYSALELESAGVIATLSQQSIGPLVPRKSDGANAELVTLAQRRIADSPRTERSPSVSISSLVNQGASEPAWR